MIDDKIKFSVNSIDSLENENELPKIKKRKNSETELMIQKPGKGNEINEIQKSKIISFYNDNILKFRLKERLKNIFTLGKLGNILTLYPDENGNPKIFIGPNIVIYIIMNILISLIFFLYLYYFYNLLGKNDIIIGFIIYIFWIIIYLILFLFNPGYPKISFETLKGNKDMKYCNKCEIFFNPKNKVKHCNKCDICIEGRYCHSFFIGKCIGKGNICFYVLFISINLIIVLYFIFYFWFFNIK